MFVAEEAMPGERTATPEDALDTAGRLMVGPLLTAMARQAPAVIVTDRDLMTPESSQLFGISSYSRQIAVVSTFRLREPGGDLTRRLQNVMAHERGHLAGLLHCRTENCLMHPARTPQDIDARAEAPCGQCPKRGTGLLRSQAWRMAVALLFLAVLVGGVQGVMRLLVTPFDAPFT